MYFLSFLSERVNTFPERCHIPGKARQENQLHRPRGRRRFCCSYHRRRSRPRGHVLVLRRSAPLHVWRWAARSGPPECRPAARFARTSPPWGWRCRHWENCHCDHLLVENPRRGSFVNACATSSDVTKSVGTTQGEHVPVDKRQSEYVTVSTQREHMTVKYATANIMKKKNVTVRRHKARATRDRRQRKADMWRRHNARLTCDGCEETRRQWTQRKADTWQMRGKHVTVTTTEGKYVTDARKTRDSQPNARRIHDSTTQRKRVTVDTTQGKYETVRLGTNSQQSEERKDSTWLGPDTCTSNLNCRTSAEGLLLITSFFTLLLGTNVSGLRPDSSSRPSNNFDWKKWMGQWCLLWGQARCDLQTKIFQITKLRGSDENIMWWNAKSRRWNISRWWETEH